MPAVWWSAMRRSGPGARSSGRSTRPSYVGGVPGPATHGTSTRSFVTDQRRTPLPVARGRPARQRARHSGAVAPKRGGGKAVFPSAAHGPAIGAAGDRHRQAGQLSGRSPRVFAVGDPSPLEVPQQPGRELPSADQGRGAGDETLRLAWAGPTVAVCVRQHPTALSAPSSSDLARPNGRTEMTNRFAVWNQIITAAAA